MTYQEFLEECKEFKQELPYGMDDYEKESLPKDILFIRYSTGGVSGGSCWDSSNPTDYTNDDPIPDFEDFAKIVEKVCPDIKYLQFRKLEKLFKELRYTEYEYYGNCTYWTLKYIDLNAVYNSLKSQGLI